MGARKAALEAEIAAESERLRLAKEESAAFIANMRRLCSSELEFLDGVPEIQVSAPSAQAVQDASVDEQVHSIESSVLSSFAEPRRRLKRRPKPNRNRQRSRRGRPLHRKKRTLPIRMPPRIWNGHRRIDFG